MKRGKKMDENEVYMEECTEFGDMQGNQTERAGKMCGVGCVATGSRCGTGCGIVGSGKHCGWGCSE